MTTSTARHARRLLPALLAGVLVLAGCGAGDDADGGTDAVADDATAAADEGGVEPGPVQGDEEPAADTGAEDGDVEPSADDGGGATLADVVATTPDGGTLTLGDFADRQVFVETFATWCSNCRRQLATTQQAAAQVGDDAVFLALSVETDLDPAALADYAADNGFDDLVFAVLEDEALAVLVDRFGNSVLNPPATPKFTIAADGNTSSLTTGPESLEEILAQLQA